MLSSFWCPDNREQTLFTASKDLREIPKEKAVAIDCVLSVGGCFSFSSRRGLEMWVVDEKLFVDVWEAFKYVTIRNVFPRQALTGKSYVSGNKSASGLFL